MAGSRTETPVCQEPTYPRTFNNVFSQAVSTSLNHGSEVSYPRRYSVDVHDNNSSTDSVLLRRGACYAYPLVQGGTTFSRMTASSQESSRGTREAPLIRFQMTDRNEIGQFPIVSRSLALASGVGLGAPLVSDPVFCQLFFAVPGILRGCAIVQTAKGPRL